MPLHIWFNNKSIEPTAEQCSLIWRTLRPEFEFFESPKARALKRHAELKLYTEEQCGALDAMEGNERVIFEGPAGTGKTLLAIESARRSASMGRHVLFVCFNRLLGRWLEEQSSCLGLNVACGTIHRQMLAVAGIGPDGQSEDADFWQNRLPEIAANALIATPPKRLFDEIIVDEAQDRFVINISTF